MPNYATYPSLKGKVILITGGATGIGAVMVEEFMRQHAEVLFIDIQEEALMHCVTNCMMNWVKPLFLKP